MKRKAAIVAGLLMLVGVAVLLPQAVQQPRPLSDLIPAGPLLYIEAKDLAALVKDWNGSNVKNTWLGSGNYQVFSNSRLFLRLKEAQDQFGAAAGLAPDMSLLDAAAGTNSALALYDIGNLEFLYITRMPSARAYQSMLWQSRARFEPRKSAGVDYFVRRAQNRTAAFAVAGDLMLIATQEQAMASALALIAGQTPPAMKQETWYQRATAAQTTAGEIRMTLNFQRTARTPYFRSYWIQHNTSSLAQFDSIIADLDRSPTEYRERRALLRAEPATDLRAAEAAVAEISKVAPPDAGLLRAWAKPDPAAVMAMLEQKMFAPRADTEERYKRAPGAGDPDAAVGSEGDLETRIDEPPLTDDSTKLDLAPLRMLVESNPVEAMLQVETSRASADGVFVNTPRSIALLGARPWDAGAAQTAVDAVAAKLWAVTGPLSGLGRIHAGASGRVLILANVDDLVTTMVGRAGSAAALPGAQYAMRFLHASELPRFQRMMTLIDYAGRPSGYGAAREPLFFSENIASLGRALGRLRSVTLDSHDDGTMVKQNVVYKLQ